MIKNMKSKLPFSWRVLIVVSKITKVNVSASELEQQISQCVF